MTVLEARNDLVTLRGDVNRNWAIALQSYREALDLYRRVMAIRARPSHLSSHSTARPPINSTPDRASSMRIQPQAFSRLTPREHELLPLLTSGYTNRQIADRLMLTRGTVANHVCHILAKLALDNRTQVAALVLASHRDGDADDTVPNGSTFRTPAARASDGLLSAPPAPLRSRALPR